MSAMSYSDSHTIGYCVEVISPGGHSNLKRKCPPKGSGHNTAMFRGDPEGFDSNSSLIHGWNHKLVTLPGSGVQGEEAGHWGVSKKVLYQSRSLLHFSASWLMSVDRFSPHSLLSMFQPCLQPITVEPEDHRPVLLKSNPSEVSLFFLLGDIFSLSRPV